jgi:hypothetical protein
MTAELGAGDPLLSDHRTSGTHAMGARLRGRLMCELGLVSLNQHLSPRPQVPRPVGDGWPSASANGWMVTAITLLDPGQIPVPVRRSRK